MSSDCDRVSGILNSIQNNDRAIGYMVSQIHASAKDERYYVAMTSLFVLVEQILRFNSDADEHERFQEVIDHSLKLELIDGKEYEILEKVRKLRNEYMHAQFHGDFFEFDGLLYPANDDELAEVIYAKFGYFCFCLIKKLSLSDPEA